MTDCAKALLHLTSDLELPRLTRFPAQLSWKTSAGVRSDSVARRPFTGRAPWMPLGVRNGGFGMPTGTIARLLIDKGFGFIRDESGSRTLLPPQFRARLRLRAPSRRPAGRIHPGRFSERAAGRRRQAHRRLTPPCRAPAAARSRQRPPVSLKFSNTLSAPAARSSGAVISCRHRDAASAACGRTRYVQWRITDHDHVRGSTHRPRPTR